GAESTIAQTESTLGETEAHLNDLGAQAAAAGEQFAAVASVPGELMAQAGDLDAQGQALIAGSFDVESQLQTIQDEFLAGMQGVPEAPPAPMPMAGGAGGVEVQRAVAAGATDGLALQRDAADYGYGSRVHVNVADLWSSPEAVSPEERAAQEQQRAQQAQQ